jgi:glycolate oxidase FAD binding subunit
MSAATILRPDSVAGLAAMLRDRPGHLRVCGSGSRQTRLPAADAAHRLRLDGLATIERLDAQDQTCTVQCGVAREHLDAALAAVGLELPCPGGGTLGGLFASDPIGAATPGGASPRTLLLGMDAVLADGTEFRSGARVVKSVAGFDVHRLLVGSEGRLFVATRLHLRCKPKPRTTSWFCRAGLDPAAAFALLQQLRPLPAGLHALQLERAPNGACAVRGCLAGRASFVASCQRRLRLPESTMQWRDQLEPVSPATPNAALLAGVLLGSALPQVLATLPAHAALLWHGGGRCEVSVGHDGIQSVLASLQAVGGQAVIVHGHASQRGKGTPVDPGQQQLTAGLKQALDPHGILV